MNGSSAEAELFLGLSAVLTGFETIDLRATGMVEAYLAVFREKIASPEVRAILAAWKKIAARHPHDRDAQEKAVAASMWSNPQMSGPLGSLTVVWYLGNWYEDPKDPGTVVSGDAYQRGLVWPAIGTKPLGTRPGGFASWGLPPTVPPIPDGGDQ